MTNQPTFPAVLRRALADSAIRPYRLALRCRLSATTICKILNYQKYKRRATEAQVLRMFVGLIRDDVRRLEILDLVEVTDEMLFRKLDDLLEPKKMTCTQLALLSNVGEERLEQCRAGRQRLSEALKLRLVIEARCRPDEIDVANVLLQAAGFYIMGGGSEAEGGRQVA
jgi:hypothetical protein